MPSGDPFRTEHLRHTVLDAWSASPPRFREDANAEEDLALGGYRDRLVVELAQNAADAAVRAAVPGRLRLTLVGGTLTAANTGAQLDAAGVESLSTLRASAKRGEGDEQAVGRFGVGFSAVLAVSDEPAVLRRDGDGVRWSLAEARRLTARAAEESPGLAAELSRRDGHVPVLRLPLPAPAPGAVPEGYDTAVRLPLRDAAAEELAARLLGEIDDALLLTLAGLTEVVVETPEGVRTLTRRTGPAAAAGAGPAATADAGPQPTPLEDAEDPDTDVLITDGARTTRWRTRTVSGRIDPALLAGRPVEERLRPFWSVTWAVPVDGNGEPEKPRTADVLHAPTPTDEPLGLSALLIASLPLEPTRRHVAPGPLTDFLVEEAAAAYAALLRAWRPVTAGTIALVPGPLGRSELDGALRGAILRLLPETPFLPRAGGRPEVAGRPGAAADRDPAGYPEPRPAAAAPDGESALRPRDALLLEGAGAATVEALADVYANLLPAGLERSAALRTLAVQRLPLAEAIESLAGAERAPGWWHRLYESLAGTDPEALSGLPVPLAGGGSASGPRQVLLPLPGSDAAALTRLGLKAAHPDAAHPLLEKLGATAATPRAVLTTPQVRAAVAASLDADEAWDVDEPAPGPDELAGIVLGLVRDAHLAPGDEPWLAALALPDEDGELAPAGELVYPGSPFEQVIREGELAACDAALAERWGEQPLTAVGVQAAFALVRAADVVLDPDELEPRDGDYPEPDDAGLLDAVDVWCEDVLDRLPETSVPPVLTELIGVRDLDLVDDDAWPQALAMLSRPPLRDALTQPARVLLPGAEGGTQTVRPYTAWWLRGNPVLDGRRPAGLRAADGDPLLAGLYEPADTSTVQDDQVLRALGVRTSAAALLDEPGGAAELLARLADPSLPVAAPRLHALYGLLADLDPEQVTLPDELRAVVDGRLEVVDASAALVADAPDLVPLAAGRPLLPVPPRSAADLAELLQVRRLSEEYPAPVREAGEPRVVPEAVRALLGPGTPAGYEEHDDLTIDGVELDWRLTPDGTLHAATLEGVAAGLAWSAGHWHRRFETAALLEDLSRTDELAQARWFD